MIKPVFVALLSFFLPFNSAISLFSGSSVSGAKANSGTLEKLAVESGDITLDLDLNRLNGIRAKRAGSDALRFGVERDSFFTVMVFNDELRGPIPGSMAMNPEGAGNLPQKLSSSWNRLVLEKTPWGEHFEFVVRDVKSGFTFFNIEGHEFEYVPEGRSFRMKNGRVLLSNEFAAELGRPADAGTVFGKINVTITMRQVQVTEIIDGEVKTDVLPADLDGTTPGPDVIVGDVYSLTQFGSTSTHVGLAVGTNSCNAGTEDLNWFALPSNDHPVIPQNLFRLSGGPNNDERFEQIGQSSVKHAFTALTQNLCNFGCNGVGGSRLGSGCSDPYSASLNAGPNLGSRAWINPFNGDYPRGDSGTSPNTHSGHSHNGTSHRILTKKTDLDTSANQGASYYAEGQYITPHEYDWCQANPGQCNMYNNVSYRQYSVVGTTSFSFSPVGSTVREQPAISAWPGATFVQIEPDPGNDGIGTVAYKVTNPSPGVWHYEYAVYNQNLDRAIQSFTVPLGSGITLNNVGFHSPPQHPGTLNDGTVGNAGFSEAAWTQTQTTSMMDWSTESFAQNPNANAIRWGTMYNFRFDSNRPPQAGNATVGFFKTGSPINVPVMVPTPSLAAVSVSGRVLGVSSRGVSRAYVSITGTTGGTRTVGTNQFGNYYIGGITPGDTYTIEVFSKGYSFTPQVMQIDGNLSGIDFSPSP